MNWILKVSLAAIALLGLGGCAGAPPKGTSPSPPQAMEAQVETLQRSGAPGNRINVVLLGDGYRTEDQAKLTRDAQRWLDAFRRTSPFSNYASYFNVKLIHLVSREDGADNGVHGLGVTRDTALGAAFQNANPAGQAPDYRLLVVDNARAQAVVMALAPECTTVLVLVNDPNYGGSGGVVPTFSAHPDSGLIALHELGHAFGGLADEYQCGDTRDLPATLEAFPNVTTLQGWNLIKWRNWIEPGLPLPTPADTAHPATLGLFEGAYFHDTGVFRPRQTCRMRSLTDAFCEVCSEAIVRRIYGQIRPVDAAPASTLSADGGAVLSFSVTRPLPAPDTTQVTWTVDGVATSGTGDSLTLPAGALALGVHAISAHVVDATPLVRTGADRLASVQTWTVTTGITASVAAPPRPEPAQHLLIRVLRTPEGFREVERRIIDQPLPSAPVQGHAAWRIEALDAAGQVQFQTGIEDPALLRGEFEDAALPGRIQGYRLGADRPLSFLIRMPALENPRLAIVEPSRTGVRQTVTPCAVGPTQP